MTTGDGSSLDRGRRRAQLRSSPATCCSGRHATLDAADARPQALALARERQSRTWSSWTSGFPTWTDSRRRGDSRTTSARAAFPSSRSAPSPAEASARLRAGVRRLHREADRRGGAAAAGARAFTAEPGATRLRIGRLAPWTRHRASMSRSAHYIPATQTGEPDDTHAGGEDLRGAGHRGRAGDPDRGVAGGTARASAAEPSAAAAGRPLPDRSDRGQKFHRATSTHNLTLMMSLWAPGAVFNIDQQTLTGKAQIQALVRDRERGVQAGESLGVGHALVQDQGRP